MATLPAAYMGRGSRFKGLPNVRQEKALEKEKALETHLRKTP